VAALDVLISLSISAFVVTFLLFLLRLPEGFDGSALIFCLPAHEALVSLLMRDLFHGAGLELAYLVPRNEP
jgi:hypothetical protein